MTSSNGINNNVTRIFCYEHWGYFRDKLILPTTTKIASNWGEKQVLKWAFSFDNSEFSPFTHVVDHPIRYPSLLSSNWPQTSGCDGPSCGLQRIRTGRLCLHARRSWPQEAAIPVLCMFARLSLLLPSWGAPKENADGVNNFFTYYTWVSIHARPPHKTAMGYIVTRWDVRKITVRGGYACPEAREFDEIHSTVNSIPLTGAGYNQSQPQTQPNRCQDSTNHNCALKTIAWKSPIQSFSGL